MSCTVCGSSVAGCGCRQSTDRCAPAGLGSGCGSGCQPVVYGTPQPAYMCAPACPESHLQKITIQQFKADVNLVDTWNVPDCGESATINTEALKSIVVGSYLWNPDYGYFEVSAFNEGTGQVTLINTCQEGNAEPGTTVPSCTNFTVTDPPADQADTGNPCLELDFTAPDVDDCIDITLSSTEGLIVGYKVQIGTGIYRLSDIKPNFVVTICNDGEGITPGTSVIAKNAAGGFNYCLGIISVNPCEGDPVLIGTSLVCSDDLIKPIEAAIWNEGLVTVLGLVGTDDHTVHIFPIDAGLKYCANLLTGVNITVGDSTYTFTFSGTLPPGFVVGELVYSGTSDLRFRITGITGLNVDVTSLTVPDGADVIPAGAWICTLDCCESSFLDSLARYSNQEELLDQTPHLLDTVTDVRTYSSPHLNWDVENLSISKGMRVLTTFQLTIQGKVGPDDEVDPFPYLVVQEVLNFIVDGGATQSPSNSYTYTIYDGAGEWPQTMVLVWIREDIIAAGETFHYESWATVNLPVYLSSSGTFNITDLFLQVEQVGVPLL